MEDEAPEREPKASAVVVQVNEDLFPDAKDAQTDDGSSTVPTTQLEEEPDLEATEAKSENTSGRSNTTNWRAPPIEQVWTP